MTQGVFVAGTGTDVGKTYIAASISRELRGSHKTVGYWKAVLSGAESVKGRLIPGDAVFVKDRAGLREDQIAVTYMFEGAYSPHLAAARAHKIVDGEQIRRDFQNAVSRCDYLVAEGCGGIICPLAMGDNPLMLSDVIAMTGLNVVIVAESGLGSINSAALTSFYGRYLELPIKGFIMNRYDEFNPMHRDNLCVIESLTNLPVLATMGLCGERLQWRRGDLFGWLNQIP